jgi:cellobiose phosphorylase
MSSTWWHEEEASGAGKGVRTRYSDDLLWLPLCLCEYIEENGDEAILERWRRISNPSRFREEERERYEAAPPHRRRKAFGACLRAAELVIERGPERRLALFGGGDWNDGMNLVGAGGRGESVWLTWFASRVFQRLAELIEKRPGWKIARAFFGKTGSGGPRLRTELGAGTGFLRGYYDDGRRLDSCGGQRCEIDSVAQSFGARGASPTRRARGARFRAP